MHILNEFMNKVLIAILSVTVFSCSQENQNKECKDNLDLVYNHEKIGTVCIENDSVVYIHIESKLEHELCNELRLVPGLDKEYLQVDICPEAKSTKNYKIIKPMSLEEHFNQNGFQAKIDSLQGAINYDSLKREGTQLIDSLIKAGDLY